MVTFTARRKVAVNAVLFGLTVVSTFVGGCVFWGAGFVHAGQADAGTLSLRTVLEPKVMGLGLLYAAVLMTILIGHELSHYLTCRRHGIDATLPYFIPAPGLIGTFGAFIRIKSPVGRKQQFFDIGASGPLAGFLLATAAIFAGLAFSKTAVLAPGQAIELGDPLLIKLAVRLFFPHVPAGSQIILHPVGVAGWVGLLVTALNLIPMGQLDGGHIAYAVAGRHAKAVSRLALAGLVLLSIFCYAGWLIWVAVILIIGARHPAVFDEGAPLSAGRKILAVCIVVIFALSFIPAPIPDFTLKGLFLRLVLGVK